MAQVFGNAVCQRSLELHPDKLIRVEFGGIPGEEMGVKPGRRRLFVIDGSKALRKAIDAVHGADNPVQGCRSHKLRNVIGYLPKELQGQTAAALRAARRLEPEEG